MPRFPNPYILNPRNNCVSYPVAYPTEQQSIYFNTNEPLNNTDFPNYSFNIVTDGDYQIVSTVPGLMQDIISTDVYRLYIIFDMPSLSDGLYRYLIKRDTDDQIIILSNPFEVINDLSIIQNETVRLRYRNSADIYNYGYEALPDFFNEVRVRIYEPDPVEFPFDAEQYKEVTTGEFQVPKFDIDEIHTFETYWFDPEMTQATAIFLAHNLTKIDDFTMTTSQGDSLTLKQNDPRNRMFKSQFKMYLKDFSTINKR